jgi:hypothetical protein
MCLYPDYFRFAMRVFKCERYFITRNILKNASIDNK